MTLTNTLKAIAPGIVIGGAIGCGISCVVDMLISENDSSDSRVELSHISPHKESHFNNFKESEPLFDSEGYNKDGYNAEGFSRQGYDLEGYDKDCYNIKGFDRCQHNRRFYMTYLARLYTLKEESLQLLSGGSYRYALLNSRTILDDTLSLLLGHYTGNNYQGAKLSTKLRICEENHLLGDNLEFIKGLHGVCKVCSPRLHTIKNENEITHQQVYFTIMQSMKLLQMAEKELLIS